MKFEPLQHIQSYDAFICGGGDYDNEAKDMAWQIPSLVFRELQVALRKGWRIFDAGCGTGLSSEPFRSPDLEIYGVEGSTLMLEEAAKKNLFSKLERMVIGKDPLPFAPHGFDLSLSLGVMAHFPSATTIPALLQQATKPGGIVAFNYVDVADYPAEFTTDDNGGTVDKSEVEARGISAYYHHESDIDRVCRELKIDYYMLTSPAYGGPIGGVTRTVIGIYEPESSSASV